MLDGERLRSLTCPVAVAELSSLGPVISKLCCLEVTAAHGHTHCTHTAQTHMCTHTYTKDEERFGMVSGHCLTLPCLTPPHPGPPQGFLALMACPLTILEDDGVVGVCAFLSASKE